MKLHNSYKPNVFALVLLLAGCAPGRPAPPAGAVRVTDSAGEHVRSWGYDIRLVDRTGDAAQHRALRAWLGRAMEADAETTGGASWPLEVRVERGDGAVTRGATITLRLPPGPWPPEGGEWVLHHELVHASFPSLPEDERWLEEGLATYLEPFVRVRVGQLPSAVMWQELARDLPQGAPRPGEGALRGTFAWHRLYWQGCVFWLGAELAVARATAGARSLRDALCAWAGAPDATTPERAFAVMDAAIGAPVLGPRFAAASAHGLADDPAALLAELGVGLHDGELVLDDAAPAAGLRRRLGERGRCAR